jgi:hypothetical protein
LGKWKKITMNLIEPYRFWPKKSDENLFGLIWNHWAKLNHSRMVPFQNCINHRFMLSCLIYLESAMKFVILTIVFTENVFQQKIIWRSSLLKTVDQSSRWPILPEARDKKNWILISENYERICLSKFGFLASRWKKK